MLVSFQKMNKVPYGSHYDASDQDSIPEPLDKWNIGRQIGETHQKETSQEEEEADNLRDIKTL